MLALIGFIVLIIFGAFCLVGAFTAWLLTSAFSNTVEWFPVILFGSIGGASLWAAVHWAPFSVNWIG